MLPLGITRGSSRTMCCLLLPKALINCVCTFPGPVFCIIVSAWTCMIMEFKLVDGVQFFLVLFVLVALPPLW